MVVVTALDLTPEDRQRLNGGVTEILSKHAFGPSELMARLAALLKEVQRSTSDASVEPAARYRTNPALREPAD